MTLDLSAFHFPGKEPQRAAEIRYRVRLDPHTKTRVRHALSLSTALIKQIGWETGKTRLLVGFGKEARGIAVLVPDPAGHLFRSTSRQAQTGHIEFSLIPPWISSAPHESEACPSWRIEDGALLVELPRWAVITDARQAPVAPIERAVPRFTREPPSAKPSPRAAEARQIADAIAGGRVTKLPSGAELAAIMKQVPEFESVEEAIKYLRANGFAVKRGPGLTWGCDGTAYMPASKFCKFARLKARDLAIERWRRGEIVVPPAAQGPIPVRPNGRAL